MKPRILFFDIETSLMEVYTFYIGNKVSIQHGQIKTPSKVICIAYKWSDEKQTHVLKWDKDQDDSKMLEKFNKIAAQADFLCAHNGQGFDVKELRGAIALRGLADSWCETPVIDTLTDCRRMFRFKSNRLNAIAKELGLGQKDPMCLDDWIEVNNGSKKALDKMVKYCKKDVVLLEKVHKRLDKYISPSNKRLMSPAGAIPLKCSECGGKHLIKYGTYTYKKVKKQKWLCKDCFKINMQPEPKRQRQVGKRR